MALTNLTSSKGALGALLTSSLTLALACSASSSSSTRDAAVPTARVDVGGERPARDAAGSAADAPASAPGADARAHADTSPGDARDATDVGVSLGADAPLADARPVNARRDGGAEDEAFIDTHTHFWDIARPAPGKAQRTCPGLPDMMCRAVPFPSPTIRVMGNEQANPLWKTFLPADFVAAAGAAGPSGVIAVEASPWIEDNRWLLELASRSNGLVLGVVGNLTEVWSDPAKLDQALDDLTRDARFVGVRIGDAGQLGNAAALQRLVTDDLTVDLNGPSWAQIDELAAAQPNLRIVVDHMGPGFALPITDGWRAGLERIKARPNVYVKVSGLVEAANRANDGTAPVALDARYREALDAVYAAVGEDRVLFATNWPVSLRNAALAGVLGLYRKYAEGVSPAAARKLFGGNARRAYELPRP